MTNYFRILILKSVGFKMTYDLLKGYCKKGTKKWKLASALAENQVLENSNGLQKISKHSRK